MNKKEYWENINKKDKELAIKYPEINGSYEIFSENGEVILKLKREQILKYPMGFIHSGVIRELSSSAVKVFNIIISLCGKYRNTTAMDRTIEKYSDISQRTLRDIIKELKYYHLISIHYLPGGSLKKRIRKITLSRWDTAQDLLIKEKKVIIGLDNKVTFLIPNPYKKRRKK
jgi:hypothetical protein